MDRMTSISTFVKIAETGGFAAAARKLGVSPSTASTQIQDLEDRLGVRLLNRSTRKVSLTESSYRHIEAPANGVAEGEPQAGAHVDIKHAPELAPEEIARKSHYKFDHAEPIARVEGLVADDGIIIGAGTRSGRTRFVLVNDRVPRTDQRCALCSRIVDKGYVRDLQTRLIYCDIRCLLGGSHMTMSPLNGRSWKVS